MNKRYEKYINKKNETKNNKNSKTILAPYKYTYSFNIKNNNSKLSKLSSKTLNLEQKIIQIFSEILNIRILI